MSISVILNEDGSRILQEDFGALLLDGFGGTPRVINLRARRSAAQQLAAAPRIEHGLTAQRSAGPQLIAAQRMERGFKARRTGVSLKAR